MGKKRRSMACSAEVAGATIRAVFEDFLETEGPDVFVEFLDHCGLIRDVDPEDLFGSILRHYQNPIGYDLEQAAHDLRTWPPIAARVRELQTEKAESRAKKDAERKYRAKASAQRNTQLISKTLN